VFHICPGGGCANTVTLTGMTIRNGNTGGAGGIYNQATLIVQDSTVGGAGGGNMAYNGGGIYSSAGTSTTLIGSTVSANGANTGGGIYNNGTLNITNSIIGGAGVGNAATADGGGIYHTAGTLTVDGSTISGNTARNGGGIYSEATLEVLNSSTIGEAGAPNQAEDAGGGICSLLAVGMTTVDGSSVSANEAKYCAGIFSQGTLNVQNGSTIGGAGAGNHATVFGGGICNQAGITTVDGSAVTDNMADEEGGGIFSYVGGTTTVTGSTISANTATEGGGIYTQDNTSTTTVDGSTVGGLDAGNIATTHGGGIYNNAGTVIVTGSRILHNRAGTRGGGVYSDQNIAGATNVSGSCIVGNNNTSFFNKWAAQQIAAGNWWGAPTGPNTPGADTVSDDVLYSGFLSAPPIPGCGYSAFLPMILR
jgi:predicted outer membrane repeat protein